MTGEKTHSVMCVCQQQPETTSQLSVRRETKMSGVHAVHEELVWMSSLFWSSLILQPFSVGGDVAFSFQLDKWSVKSDPRSCSWMKVPDLNLRSLFTKALGFLDWIWYQTNRCLKALVSLFGHHHHHHPANADTSVIQQLQCHVTLRLAKQQNNNNKSTNKRLMWMPTVLRGYYMFITV